MTIDPRSLSYLDAALADPRPGRWFTADYEAEIAFLRSSPGLSNGADFDIGDLMTRLTDEPCIEIDLDAIEELTGDDIHDLFLSDPSMFDGDRRPGLSAHDCEMILLRSSAQAWAWMLPPED